MTSSVGSEPVESNHGAESVRRRVVQLVSDAKSAGRLDEDAELRQYLALLQDRLPVYTRALSDLASQVGEATVERNLATAMQASIAFYRQIFALKVTVFTHPARLNQLRELTRDQGLGVQNATDQLVRYLAGERACGRVSADLDLQAAAWLLQGAALNFAFTELLAGEEVLPAADYAQAAVAQIRLD